MTEVKDIMTKNVATIDSKQSVLKAAEKMADLDVDYLVVISGDEVDGIVTETDIITKVIVRKKNPKIALVRDTMSSPIVAVHPLASLEEVAVIFNETGFRRLVVSSGNSLEGVISVEDLIAAETRFIQMLERYITVLKSRECM